MLYLITGLTGASKTLNAIKLVKEDETFKDRPVYHFNLQDLKIPEWTELDLDQLREWYNLPTGSVIIVDEAQEVYPVAPNGSIVPDDIMKLFRNRRLGIDLIFVTIDPTLLHAHVRKAVKFHYHIERPNNSKTATWYMYNKCETNPLHSFALKTADTKRVKLDQKYFGLYKSADQHTDKKKIPRYFWHILISALAMAIGIYFLFFTYDDDIESQPQSQKTLSASPPSQPFSQKSKRQPMSTQEYIDRLKPRIPNVPKSAPIYDDITKAVDYPRTFCISGYNNTLCRCYSQQATILDIDKKTCLHYIKNGYPFDYSIKQRQSSDNRTRVASTSTRASAIALSKNIQRKQKSQFTIVRQRSSEPPQMPNGSNTYGGIR